MWRPQVDLRGRQRNAEPKEELIEEDRNSMKRPCFRFHVIFGEGTGFEMEGCETLPVQCLSLIVLLNTNDASPGLLVGPALPVPIWEALR